MITISRGRVALACAAGKDDPRLAQPHFHRDEGDDAWWTHAGTPGVQ